MARLLTLVSQLMAWSLLRSRSEHFGVHSYIGNCTTVMVDRWLPMGQYERADMASCHPMLALLEIKLFFVRILSNNSGI
jgi:hypothetical protein